MKEEKKQKKMTTLHSNKINFWKANWALLVLIILAFIVVFSLGYVILSPYLNKKSLEKDISNMETTTLLSVDKIVCYSSAYGINNSSTQARWDLNLSQYTDIAIYLNVQTDVSSMYMDNISFSNNSVGNLGLSPLSIENFGKSPISENKNSSTDTENANNIINGNTSNIDNVIPSANVPERIDLEVSSPITLRYLNQNLKENCLISDIDIPLTFDGSILKRGKVTLSSLKNTISFTLHIIDSDNQASSLPISIPIDLENNETGKSIYDGSYLEEQIY